MQVYTHLPTGNILTVDADTATFYDQRMQEMHAVDAFAAVGIHHPNPIVTERVNAHVHEGREDVFERSIAPATGAPSPNISLWTMNRAAPSPVARCICNSIATQAASSIGTMMVISFRSRMNCTPSRRMRALAGVVNYGPSGGSLEKLPRVDLESVLPPAPEPIVAISAEEYQALRSANGPEWKHSVRIETTPPELDGHYVSERTNLPEKYQDRIYDSDLYVYNRQLDFYSPQLYDSMLAMNGPDWKHRVVVGPESRYTHAEIYAEHRWQRTAPEQDPATALSVEAAYPRNSIAPTYQQALERWEAAVHLHEDLRGRPLTPQEYQQQVEMNGPLWQHDVVLAQPVDGTQNIYDGLPRRSLQRTRSSFLTPTSGCSNTTARSGRTASSFVSSFRSTRMRASRKRIANGLTPMNPIASSMASQSARRSTRLTTRKGTGAKTPW